MKFGIVYKAIISAVLSTAIYRAFVDKDYWKEQMAGRESLIELLRVALSE
jgi:hypothetical protein